MIFIPTIPSKLITAPLLFIGLGVGETINLFGLIVDITSMSRIGSIHYALAALVFALLIVNQLITGVLFNYQLFPYAVSDQFLAAMAMARCIVTGVILFMLYFEFLQTLSIFYKVLQIDAAR